MSMETGLKGRTAVVTGGSKGIGGAIARGLAYAPYADLLWCETSKPDLAQAERFTIEGACEAYWRAMAGLRV